MAFVSYIRGKASVSTFYFFDCRFPYDHPDSPAGMGYSLTMYDSPYVEPESPVNLSLTKNSLINLFLEMEWSTPLLPVARTKRDFIQALPPFTKGRGPSQRCLVNVNVKVLGKGCIHLPCSVGLDWNVDD